MITPRIALPKDSNDHPYRLFWDVDGNDRWHEEILTGDLAPSRGHPRGSEAIVNLWPILKWPDFSKSVGQHVFAIKVKHKERMSGNATNLCMYVVVGEL